MIARFSRVPHILVLFCNILQVCARICLRLLYLICLLKILCIWEISTALIFYEARNWRQMVSVTMMSMTTYTCLQRWLLGAINCPNQYSFVFNLNKIGNDRFLLWCVGPISPYPTKLFDHEEVPRPNPVIVNAGKTQLNIADIIFVTVSHISCIKRGK